MRCEIGILLIFIAELMNYNFFATEVDKIYLLEFLFSSTNLQVFDSYSLLGQRVRQYKTVADIRSAFDLTSGGQFAVTLELWSPDFLGDVSFLKIKLNPTHCQGHTLRYRTAGLGLIQLYFGGEQDNILHHSHIGHFSEKGAAANEQNSDLTNNWDWAVTNRISRQLKYRIQKMADNNLGSSAILPGATARQKQGVLLP